MPSVSTLYLLVQILEKFLLLIKNNKKVICQLIKKEQKPFILLWRIKIYSSRSAGQEKEYYFCMLFYTVYLETQCIPPKGLYVFSFIIILVWNYFLYLFRLTHLLLGNESKWDSRKNILDPQDAIHEISLKYKLPSKNKFFAEFQIRV